VSTSNFPSVAFSFPPLSPRRSGRGRPKGCWPICCSVLQLNPATNARGSSRLLGGAQLRAFSEPPRRGAGDGVGWSWKEDRLVLRCFHPRTRRRAGRLLGDLSFNSLEAPALPAADRIRPPGPSSDRWLGRSEPAGRPRRGARYMERPRANGKSISINFQRLGADIAKSRRSCAGEQEFSLGASTDPRGPSGRGGRLQSGRCRRGRSTRLLRGTSARAVHGSDCLLVRFRAAHETLARW
jgi:hypothetical protein